MTLSESAAKVLEAAYRELNMTEEQAEQYIAEAFGLAQMDGNDIISAENMLHALSKRDAGE